MSLGHACVDVYQGAVAALVPFFVTERAYTYAAASAIVLAASLLSSVVQPLFGALTDRWAMPWLLPVSALTAGVGVAASGVGGSYALTLAAVGVSGIGVAAYHPEAARAARAAAGGGNSGMGWFALGGNVGFALAPLLVAAVVATGGLRASPLLVVPAVAGAVLCAAATRATRARAEAGRGPEAVGRDDWGSFLRLSGALVCRSVVFVGLSVFVPLYVRERTGGGDVAGTVALCVLYAGGAVGTLVGGRLADRYGRVAVVRWSYSLTVLAVAGVVPAPGWAVHLFVALTSAGLYVPFSLHVTLGQDFLPRRVGTASGVTLGLTVSVGGLAAPALGALADATSLRVALVPLVALPALGRLLLCGLREPAPPGEPVPAPGVPRTASK
ncbi:MFS transporter [Streptomyces lincolnensis]|uniref:MFS transporter n=1 Tax=Streptomyces lincolnensis TaxID=1915 RepID=UPI001E2A1A47|nr:MFS transporter [Streptomyces lincolnensis]MCD7445568.1 MFS transporter [Streptomyces lincolnensis]